MVMAAVKAEIQFLNSSLQTYICSYVLLMKFCYICNVTLCQIKVLSLNLINLFHHSLVVIIFSMD